VFSKEKDYEDVEYMIKLVPHQRQEKVRPTETQRVLVEPSPQRIEQTNARIGGRAVPRALNRSRGGSSGNGNGSNSAGPARPAPPRPTGPQTIRETIDSTVRGN
jgi:hypothetical protein